MRLHFAHALTVGVLTVLGCQGKSPTNPAAPASAPVLPPSYVPAATLLAGGERAAYEGTLGVWTLDVLGTQATLTPAREVAATPGVGSFDVDITDALTRTFCRDCVELKSIELDGNDRPVITVGIRHPFELGDPGNPITAQNRRDLFLFNVKGIILSDSNPASVNSVSLPTKVLNDPDGYYFNEGLFPTSTSMDAFPYMVFGVNESLVGTGNFNATTGQFDAMDAPSGFNVLGQGQSAVAAFTFDVDAGDAISVDLVLVGQYGQSVENKAQRMSPEYYAAEFAAGPWRVEIDDFAAPFGSAPGSPQATSVRVWDFAMGHGNFDAVYPSADYLGTSWNPDLNVELFIPDFRGTPFVPSDPATGTGAIGDPLIYSVTADNQLSAANGNYPGLLKVTSNRPVGAANPGEADDVSGIGADLDATNLIPFTEIATYLPVDIEVSAVIGQPPVADLSSSKTTVMVGNGAYFFPGPGTSDPDGTITQYVYDGDWDGVPANFTPDYIMPTPSPVAIRFPNVGSTTVGLRVRDNDNNYGYDSLVVTVTPVGTPFPPANPGLTFPSDTSTLFQTSDHVPIAVDHNFPGNVYILQDPNATSTTDYAIYRSKDFGRTFDAGTPIYATLQSHAGDNFAWISGRGISVLADGTLGLVCNTTSTAGVDGRGVYYAWIDVDQAGTGVDAGGGTHDLVRVNVNTSLDAWGDPCIWADANDPTRAYITYHFNPTGADRAQFAAVSAANTISPVRLYESTLVDTTENLAIDNVRSYLDPADNALHIVWEEFLTSTDRWIAYSKVVLNNPVGPRARLSAVTQFGAIATMSSPSVATTTNGQAVVAWTVDFDPTAGFDYDMVAAKIQDNAGALSWITPVTRYSLADGQNKGFLVGDRSTGRMTLAYAHGGTSGTAQVGNLDVRTFLLDANLAIVGGPQQLQPFDAAPGPVMTTRHDDPFGAIDPNTGESIFMWQEEGPPELTAYRWSD